MLLSSLDYSLPERRIAQYPAIPRDSAKCLVVEKTTGQIRADSYMKDMPAYMEEGDLLVRNESRVFKARLIARTTHGKKVELFLVRPLNTHEWIVLLRPAKCVEIGDTLLVGEHLFTLVKKQGMECTVRSPLSIADTFTLTDHLGSVPIPPYIHSASSRTEQDYQTLFARPDALGSVAAPTAGLHFTPTLLQALEAKGVRTASIVLHVGLGTFLPVKTATVEEHTMHVEWAELPQTTVEAIEQTKARGKKVIAIGTTSMRTLEGFTAKHHGVLKADADFLTTFIYPGWSFRVADRLLTNFHMPRTTLLALVAAFLEPNPATPSLGLERLHALYDYALAHHYRFASFGDGMLILNENKP